MHKLAEKMADCLKAKVEGIGIDNIEGTALEELGKWVDIIKDIACYDKDMRIIKAMDEAEENEEKMKYIEEYEDYPERRYYDNYRYKTSGRFAPKGKGSYMPRRGYEEPPYWHMTPDMYHDWDNMTEVERMRDLDRPSMNRMYYSGSDSSGVGNGMSGSNDGNRGGGRDIREGRSGNARRGYMETKEMGKDKQEKMKELENYMKELSTDVTEMISDASPEEKSMLKQKMQVLMTKIQ